MSLIWSLIIKILKLRLFFNYWEHLKDSKQVIISRKFVVMFTQCMLYHESKADWKILDAMNFGNMVEKTRWKCRFPISFPEIVSDFSFYNCLFNNCDVLTEKANTLWTKLKESYQLSSRIILNDGTFVLIGWYTPV